MNAALVKALLALVPTGMLFSGSIMVFSRGRSVASAVRLLGAGCLMIVVLTHIAEALQWFPRMRWGDAESLGHYLDLSSAVLGVALFPLGYLLQALRARTARPVRLDPTSRGHRLN